MNPIFDKIKNGLIVSCQAEGNDPFNSPDGVTLFAKAAVLGGAAGIRSEGKVKTENIIKNINVPVIGLIKTKFPDESVCITGSFKAVEELLEIGCKFIAVDGTNRLREGLTGSNFIREIKKLYDCIIMADIATEDEAELCARAGSDCISTTLSGYTPETSHYPKDKPDFDLVSKLSSKLNVPIIAEGKINSPAFASEMIKLGAWAVVVGTAITRPRIITQWYVDSIKKNII